MDVENGARRPAASARSEAARSDKMPRWPRTVAVGLAGVRVALGAAAIASPAAAGRLWIGEGASGAERAVLVRALGGRDIALGAGALVGLSRNDQLRRWIAVGALSDFIDTVSTLAGFASLPKVRRWLVLVASAGAVVVAGTVAPLLEPNPREGLAQRR
jgi:hypothetical protein